MNRRTYLLLLLIIVCLSIPSGAAAQYTITKISGDGQTGHPGQTLEPFVVEVRQNGILAIGQIVAFVHDNGSLSNALPIIDGNGQAQSTLTLGAGPGITTVTVSIGNAEETFTATAIATATTRIPSPSEPTKLVKISDDNPLARPGDSLTFVVELQGLSGNPKPKVEVRFIFFGSEYVGSLSPEIVKTDAKGRAQTILQLSDDAAGTYELEAYRNDNFGVSTSFTITVDSSPPTATRLKKISGRNQIGFTGEALAKPFIVEVRDQYDDLLEGATVTFAVTAGGGSLSATTVTTDVNGQAESTLTLGTTPGTNTVEVSIEGASQTEIFNAKATLSPPAPTTPSIVSGEDQNGLTGETLMDPFVVQVHDQYDDPMEGVTVTFTIVGGDGVLSATTVATDANGQAETTLTLGTEPGPNIIEASVEGVAKTVTFTVVAQLLKFDLSLPAGLNLIHIPLRVRTIDGMPAKIQSVSDLYDALGGATIVNWLITHDTETQTWHGYLGEADRGTIADSLLTDQTGILASIKTPISIRLSGDALGMDGTNVITLTPGLNLVGLPLQDSRIMRVSDLFALEGIDEVITVIIVTDNGEFKAVGRADDPGDIPITGGQGFILIVQQPGTIPIIGTGWQ